MDWDERTSTEVMQKQVLLDFWTVDPLYGGSGLGYTNM